MLPYNASEAPIELNNKYAYYIGERSPMLANPNRPTLLLGYNLNAEPIEGGLQFASVLLTSTLR